MQSLASIYKAVRFADFAEIQRPENTNYVRCEESFSCWCLRKDDSGEEHSHSSSRHFESITAVNCRKDCD